MKRALVTGVARRAPTREHMLRARISEERRAQCGATAPPSHPAEIAATVSPAGKGWGTLTGMMMASARSDPREAAGSGSGLTSVAVDPGAMIPWDLLGVGATVRSGSAGASDGRGWGPPCNGDATTALALEESPCRGALADGSSGGPHGHAAGDGRAGAAEPLRDCRAFRPGGGRAEEAGAPRPGPVAVPRPVAGAKWSVRADVAIVRGLSFRLHGGAAGDVVHMLAARPPQRATGLSSGLGRRQILGLRCRMHVPRATAFGVRDTRAPAWDWRACQAGCLSPSPSPCRP